ncbi:MAG: hypothetical protein KUG77_19900 [Nannocystaceae bacterium]|nr:hypothetical protein [Nannocystaceae bacterium]
MPTPSVMLVFVLVSVLVDLGGRAQPAPDSGPPDEAALLPTVVVLVPTDADPSLLSALEAARATLRTDGIVLVVEPLEPGLIASRRARGRVGAAEIRGVFWIEHSTGFMDVWLHDELGATYLRRIPSGPEAAEAAWESVWLIVESGAESLSRGVPVGMEPTELPVDETDPLELEPVLAPEPSVPDGAHAEPPAQAQPGLGGGFSLAYLGEGVGNSIRWQDGLSGRGFLDLGRWPRLALEYALLFPPRESSVLSWRHRVAMHGGVRRRLGRRWGLEVLAELGAEAQRWSSPSGTGGGWRVVATSGVDLAARVRLGGPVWFWLSSGVGIPLNGVSYVECRQGVRDCSGADRRVALTPWPVRPRIRAGFVVALPHSLEGVRG